MQSVRTARLVLALAVLLAACARPVQENQPAPGEKPNPTNTTPVAPINREPDQETAPVRFHLFDGPAGFKTAERMRDLGPGDRAIISTQSTDLDVVLKETGTKVRPVVTAEGADLMGDAEWRGEVYALRLAPGKENDRVTITVEMPGHAPTLISLLRAAPARVTVDQSDGDAWRPISILDASALPGSGAVRLVFSKPVRRTEVEQVLLQAQPAPVRGLMQWEDDKTMIWQIAQLPPRLDFFLDGAHDQDGLPLPGGVPSLRVGAGPKLVQMLAEKPADQAVATLPPDVISAGLSRDGKHVNLMVWMPGTSRWNWQTLDLHVELESQSLKSGRVDEIQPRIPNGLEGWSVSPPSTTLAGLRPGQSENKGDLVIMDLRGGRSQVYPDFIDQETAPNDGDHSHHLAWSSDGLRVAAISFRSQVVDIVALDLPSGQRQTLVERLPLKTGAASLSWSFDGQYMQAGNLLINLQTKAVQPLEGEAGSRGVWEPQGTRLLYSVRDWGPVSLVESTSGKAQPLGDGMIVDWTGPGQFYVIRWPASESRFMPPGF